MTTNCDVCTAQIETIDGAAVFTVYDPHGRCARMGLAHAPCVGELRQQLEAGDSTVADQPATVFLDATAGHGPKSQAARVVLAKVKVLWREVISRRARPEVRRRPSHA